MPEVLSVAAVPPEDSEPIEVTERRLSTRTKLITAGALGVLGLAAAFVESRGYVNGWSPPFHSLKHPGVGYGFAWAASKVRHYRTPVIVAAGILGNEGAESAQDAVYSADHSPFHWTGLHGNRTEGIEGDVIDLTVCMGGTALFLAQDKGLGGRVRHRLLQLRSQFSKKDELPTPALNPAE